jgi:hypothetical protein
MGIGESRDSLVEAIAAAMILSTESNGFLLSLHHSVVMSSLVVVSSLVDSSSSSYITEWHLATATHRM